MAFKKRPQDQGANRSSGHSSGYNGGRKPKKSKVIGPSPREVACRGCDKLVSVLFPICDEDLADLPDVMRAELVAVHATPDVMARLRAQDVARGWFRANGAPARVITPAIAVPTTDGLPPQSWSI